MVLDKDREELEQLAVPLGGLHELQAQAQEQMCTASREPSVIMTGVSPSGFGNVAEGEMGAWRDWIRANQEAHARDPIETILKIVQLSMYGAIDPDIGITFNPLYQMTEEQLSTIRTNDSVRAGNLIDRGVIDPQEERERLARDPESGYTGLDIDKEIAPPDEAEESANLGRGTDSALGYDADFVESEHPRKDDGEFTEKAGGRETSTSLLKDSPVPKKKTVAALRDLIEAHKDEDIFVRSSSGPSYDRKQGRSMDYQTHTFHKGLSAVKIDPEWINKTDGELLSRLAEYGHRPPIKGKEQKLWIYKAKQVGTDSDGYDSITDIEPIGVIDNALVRYAPLMKAQSVVSYYEKEVAKAKSLEGIDPLWEATLYHAQRHLKEAQKELDKWENVFHVQGGTA